MYLAYKYVALAVLLAEANFNAERLDLPMERPIQESQLTLKHIQDPKFLRDTGFGGRVDSGGYTFTEGGRTAYHHFIKLAPFGRGTVTEQNEVLSHQQSLITSNGAYELAVGRLKAIDVEVRGLEKTNTVEVRQRWFWGKSPATRILLPIFDVRWGSWDRSKIDVVVDGRTKELLELTQHDGSFSRRPAQLIRYVDELLEITDEQFQHYSPLEKSNLVARFAVNWSLTPNVVTPPPRKYLAYRYVGLAALLAEANFNAERLNLPVQHPVQESQLTLKSVLDPDIYGYFGGRVDAGRCSFCERDRSRARLLAINDPSSADFGALLRSKPLITTNEAYQLAVTALKAIDVDVQELEKSNKAEVQQQVWSGRNEVSPIFEVHWGTWDEPKIVAIVNGKEKKITFLKQNDLSFSKRPTELIRNRDELLAISDDEFQRYSPTEKSNLVARFAANYPLAIQAATNRSAVSPTNPTRPK